MSDLRIRSEAIPDAVWPQRFVPPLAGTTDVWDDAPDDDFGPFLTAAARALTILFGIAVTVRPRRAPAVDGPADDPAVAAVLAACLATIRLGGDPAREADLPGAGVVLDRHAAAIGDALAAVARRAWPVGCRLATLDLDIACGAIAGLARVAAPPAAAPPAPAASQPVPVTELPMRVRVEIASTRVAVASLMPLRPGTVLPINPVADMALVVGDRIVGRAVVAPLPDGRQQASIIAIGVSELGGRA